MAVGNTFPVQSKLHQWGISTSPTCLLCGAERETLCHTQCLCAALTQARIAAHHHCWTRIFNLIASNIGTGWTLLPELTINSLAALAAPSQLGYRNSEWARLADRLDDNSLIIEDETGEAIREFSDLARAILSASRSRDQAGLARLLASSGALLGPACSDDQGWVADNTQNPEPLLDMIDAELTHLTNESTTCSIGRKRPDGIALNWKERTVHLLEFTRCFDSDRTALDRSDSHKTGKYAPLLQLILHTLGHGWSGAVLSFSAGVRGSVQARVWTDHLKILGLTAPQSRTVLEQSVTAVLEALDIIFTARTAAIAAINNR